MGYKYCNLRVQKDSENLIYIIDLFCHDVSVASMAPNIGALAPWAPTPAYVIDYKREPDGPHYEYLIRARADSSVNKTITQQGIVYKTTRFYADSDVNVPVIGQIAPWAPSTAYITDVKVVQLGDYKAYEITALTDFNVLKSEESDGVHYKITKFYDDSSTDLPYTGQLAPWAPTAAYVVGWKSFAIGTYKAYEIEARSVQNILRKTTDRGIYYEKTFYMLASEMSSLPGFGDAATWAPTDISGAYAYVFDVETKMMGDGSYYVTIRACEAKYRLLG